MSGLTEEQYKKEYDEAIAKIDAASGQTDTTEQILDEVPKAAEPEKVEPEEKAEPVDPVKSETDLIREELEKTKKALKDTQAWGTKSQQRLAEIERERQAAEREATRPAILEANPDLADAIRHVVNDPAPQLQREQQEDEWKYVVAKAHPGIFDDSLDKELEKAVYDRLTALGDAISDPIVAIREITAEKLAFTERQIGKRFIIEQEKQKDKQALSVPKLGGSAERTNPSKDDSEVQRIKSMSDADFAKEVRKAKGY